MDPYVVAALIGGPFTLAGGVLIFIATRRGAAESHSIAQETLDLSVLQAQVAAFSDLASAQSRAIDQRDTEILMLRNRLSQERGPKDA